MSDERQQSTALLAAALAGCLWLSHEATEWLPMLPGTVDLRPWVKVWNRPIIINWPVATALFSLIIIVGWKAYRSRSQGPRIKKPEQTRDEEYPPIE